jgi:FkbM family methyltransferase
MSANILINITNKIIKYYYLILVVSIFSNFAYILGLIGTYLSNMTLTDLLLNNIIPEKTNRIGEKTINKLDKIKNSFPRSLRLIIFGKWNPIYVYFIFLKERKRHDRSILLKHNIFSVDFISYIGKNKNLKICFEDFYLEEDLFALNRFIKYRILSGINKSGFEVLKKDFLSDEEKKKELVFKKLKKSVIRKKGSYEFVYNGISYKLPINRVDPYIYSERYGLPNIPLKTIERLEGKIFIDIGAFIGDTAIMLKDYKPSKIVCFEPDEMNREILNKTIILNGLSELVEVRTFALSDKIGTMSFIKDNASSKLTNEISEQTEVMEVSTLDTQFSEKDKVGLIKMDVEGFERFVIKGGKELIVANKPVLLISLYHTGADFFEIPKMIRDFSSDVRFRFIDINPFCPNLGEKILIAYF